MQSNIIIRSKEKLDYLKDTAEILLNTKDIIHREDIKIKKDGEYYCLVVRYKIFLSLCDIIAEFIIANAVYAFLKDILYPLVNDYICCDLVFGEENHIFCDDLNHLSDVNAFFDVNDFYDIIQTEILLNQIKEILLSDRISAIKDEISFRIQDYTKHKNTINLKGFAVFMLRDCIQCIYDILCTDILYLFDVF